MKISINRNGKKIVVDSYDKPVITKAIKSDSAIIVGKNHEVLSFRVNDKPYHVVERKRQASVNEKWLAEYRRKRQLGNDWVKVTNSVDREFDSGEFQFISEKYKAELRKELEQIIDNTCY